VYTETGMDRENETEMDSRGGLREADRTPDGEAPPRETLTLA